MCDAGNNSNEPIRVSGVEYDRPLGKSLALAPDGKTVIKEHCLEARASVGRAICRDFSTAEEAFNFRLDAEPSTMFLSGNFDPLHEGAQVVPQRTLVLGNGSADTSQIAVTKTFLSFRPGPGLISIDIDVKSADDIQAIYPETGTKTFKTADDALSALYDVLPEAKGCPVLVMPSASSMIECKSDCTRVKGPGGWRILLVTQDASQTPRILDAIHLRCWAQNIHHFAFVSKGGSFLVRSLADQALARPTQPDYPTAVLSDDLRKIPGAYLTKNLNGRYFDPASVDVSNEARRTAQENMNRAKSALLPQKARAENTVKASQVARMIDRGVSRVVAERAVALKLERGLLLGSDTVTFADGSTLNVATLLSEAGQTYDGENCLDPLEPDYDGGRPVGIFYWNEGVSPGLHSFAHGSRFYKMRHDLSSLVATINGMGANSETIVHAFALAEITDLEMASAETEAASVLGLGNKRRDLRAAVEQERQRISESWREHDEADGSGDHAVGPQPLNQRQSVNRFPHIRTSQAGVPSLIDHQANVAHMLDAYGITLRYNMITKRMEWGHPDISNLGDDAENSLYSQMISLAALNGLPSINLDTHLTALGNARAHNPVTDFLSGLEWDGKSRIRKLVDSLDPSDQKIALIAFRVFLIQACAAADHAEKARAENAGVEAHFEYVLVLVGEQGAGKTKGLRKFLPTRLRAYYREAQVLNLNDKDSVKRVLSNWIVELGELDATFQKSAISQKKAFLSQSEDEIRAPYARKPSRYGRRTVFVGTVNEESFLADETGNRRYLPLTVGQITLDWDDHELEQLWAEVWARYVSGENWWPTADEEKSLEENADKYRVRTEIEERIERHYDWLRGPQEGGARRTASEIYAEVMPHNARRPSEKDLKTVGASLRRMYIASGTAEMQKGQLVTKSVPGGRVSLNSKSGKNRGWLLPPKSTHPNMAESAALAHANRLGIAETK